MTDDSVARKHVLVIDDEPDFAAMLRSILVNGGYTVAMAYNWENTIEELDAKTPDLITLDVNMPAKSGAFFYWDIKANRKFREIPVVVVTGLTRDDWDVENVIRSLMKFEQAPDPEAYLEKPVDGPHFLRTVQEALLPSESEHC